MKKFLIKISLFLGLSCLALFSCFAVYYVRLNTMSFAIPADKKVVFIGDSHIATSVNEAFIPSAYNFAKGADPYINQYFRLNALLKDNLQIKTVFITATPHSLARYGDGRIFNDYTMQNVVPYFLPFYGEKEWMMYLKKTPVKFFKYTFKNLLRIGKQGVNPSQKSVMARLGAYSDSKGKNLEKSIKVERGLELGIKKLHGDDSAGTSLQTEYLKKIVALVRSRGAKIIFLNPPLYHEDEFFDVPYFKNLLKENFEDVEFWDYGNFPIPDDYRQDINHLNRWGAEVFSKELAARMKREGIIEN